MVNNSVEDYLPRGENVLFPKAGRMRRAFRLSRPFVHWKHHFLAPAPLISMLPTNSRLLVELMGLLEFTRLLRRIRQLFLMLLTALLLMSPGLGEMQSRRVLAVFSGYGISKEVIVLPLKLIPVG